jgi:hypothetical protein
VLLLNFEVNELENFRGESVSKTYEQFRQFLLKRVYRDMDIE